MGVYQLGTPIEISDTFTVDGVETNPTTVTYTIRDPSGASTVYVNGDAEVTNPSVGNFVLSLDPPTLPGEYLYEVTATGTVTASRAGSFSVMDDVATPTPVSWAVSGPCTTWATSQAVWDCCGQPMTTIGEGTMATECPVDMSQFALEASQILYELSGRRFSGHCSRTAAACQDACWCGWQQLSRGYIVGPWDWWGWGWDFGTCWQWPCGHPPLLKLAGYPVREITEIVIDGVVLDPSTYQLLGDRRHVVRLDGEAWPFCSINTENTITYTYGQDPPLIGIAGAAELGCELYKACGSGECQLPYNTTQVSRQGVTINRPAFATWAFQEGRIPGQGRGWRTGLVLVDSFLNAYNPSALKRRPTVWAPSTYRRYAPSVGL